PICAERDRTGHGGGFRPDGTADRLADAGAWRSYGDPRRPPSPHRVGGRAGDWHRAGVAEFPLAQARFGCTGRSRNSERRVRKAADPGWNMVPLVVPLRLDSV